MYYLNRGKIIVACYKSTDRHVINSESNITQSTKMWYSRSTLDCGVLVALIMSFPHPDSIFHVGDGKHVDNVTESSRGKVGVFDSKLLLGKPEGFMSPAGLLE